MIALRPRASCTIPVLLIVSFGCLVWLFVTQTIADADLWGHLRFGLDLLHTHRLPERDTYSFTADRIWINHEWLSELVMAVAYHVAGPLGLTLLKAAAITTVAAIVTAIGRAEGAPPAQIAVLAILAVLTTYTRTQVIRPQLFSIVLFCVLLYTFRAAERGRYAPLTIVPVCFAVWVNVHGAWIVGFACLSIWVLSTAWIVREKRWTLAAVWICAAAATLVNPYGAGMWRFLFETVRPARPDITDWKPLVDLPAGIIALDLVLPSIAACAIVLGRQRVRLQHLAIVALLAWGTWRVGRVDAFLQAAIAILFAPQILSGFRAFRARLRARIWRLEVPFGSWLASAAVLGAFVTGLLHLRTIALEGPWLPDPSGVESVKRACPRQTVLTWFDWGEYAIWHLSPAGIRVSMDGRRETVYSDAVIGDHWAFYRNESHASDYPERIAAECVWLPTRLDAVVALERRGWIVVGRTEGSTILRRSPVAALPPPTLAPDGPRQFPGP